MFKKLFTELDKAKEELAQANLELKVSIDEAKKLNKESKQLLSKIEAAEKRNGVLLLEDLTNETIEKLQSLTDDNVVIIFTSNDNSRIEIRKQGTNYKRNNGGLF